MNSNTTRLVAGIVVIVIAIVVYVVNWLYHRSSKEVSFVRTGFMGERVVINGGAFVLPFILSVSFLGQFISAWFRHRETAVLLFIATSLPLFFLVGVAWPVEAIPPWVHTLSLVFPSTSAIDGLVRINQMDATLADVARDWGRLWILAGLYLCLAALVTRLPPRREIADARPA